MSDFKIKGRIFRFEKDKIFIVSHSGTKFAILEEEETIKNVKKSYNVGDIFELLIGLNKIILNPKITEKPSSLVEKNGILYI